MKTNYNGQAEQDKFVIKLLNGKKNGSFLEIGSNHPIKINNTYLLETEYDYKGIMIEYDKKYAPLYNKYRKSHYIIHDATKINYLDLLKKYNMPKNIDYLQIDLEVANGSTLNTLKKLHKEIFDEYKFATITFEHDIYRSNYLNTRAISREIFENNGYYPVFYDINNSKNDPFEDWYVYPSLVNMEYIYKLQEANKNKYKEIKNYMNVSINTLYYMDINYDF